MKVGDLVMDVDPHYSQQLGIIVEIDAPEGMYKVMFDHGPEWLTAMHLDVVSSFNK